MIVDTREFIRLSFIDFCLLCVLSRLHTLVIDMKYHNNKYQICFMVVFRSFLVLFR